VEAGILGEPRLILGLGDRSRVNEDDAVAEPLHELLAA